MLERISPLFNPTGIPPPPLHAKVKLLYGRILEGFTSTDWSSNDDHLEQGTEPNQPHGRKANQPYVSSIPSKPVCIGGMWVRCPANPPRFRLKKDQSQKSYQNYQLLSQDRVTMPRRTTEPSSHLIKRTSKLVYIPL